MKDYHINIFWTDDDDCYIADIPDLVCCSAHGATPAETLAEVEIARALWLEVAKELGRPIPHPTLPANHLSAGGLSLCPPGKSDASSE